MAGTEEAGETESQVLDQEESGLDRDERIIKLPLTRIKAIIKTDPDITLASHDAVISIAKATELFLQSMAKDAFGYTKQTKRKTVQKKDFDLAIENSEEYAFLEGAL